MLKAEVKRLLLKVKKHIQDDPRRLDLNDYMYEADSYDASAKPEYGTVGCIAGLIVACDYAREKKISIKKLPKSLKHLQGFQYYRKACQIIGLDKDSYEATNLFGHRRRFDVVQVEEAVQRIDEFIARNDGA